MVFPRKRNDLVISNEKKVALVLLVFCGLVGIGLLSSQNQTTAEISSTSTKTSATCEGKDSFRPRTGEESNSILQIWKSTRDAVKRRELTYLEPQALHMHVTLIDEVERNGVPGIIIECGVAKAGSSIVFAAVKNQCRELHLHDTFEGMPSPSDRDGKDVHERYKHIQAGKQDCQQGRSNCDPNYYGNIANLLEFDKQQFTDLGYNLQEHNVFFHKGLFDDTVWPKGPVAYAHLDGDWYVSTKSMLDRIGPYLTVGGYFVLDDVYEWSGARDAFSEFFNVDIAWLKQQTNRSCYVEAAGKHFRVFLDERAAAQVLATRETSLLPCTKGVG